MYLFDLGVRNALLRRPLDRPLPDERERRVKRSIVVFLGTRRQRVGRVDVLPLADFLEELPG